MFQSTALLALVSALSASALPRGINSGDIKCPITLDGRVAASLKSTDFDSYATSPFNPDYVKGEGTKFSDIILFPADAGLSRFDNSTDKAFEVTIADNSIFQTQKGFRRAGLQIQGDENAGSPGVKGVQTIHFSVKLDAAKPLNLSHEYIVCFPHPVSWCPLSRAESKGLEEGRRCSYIKAWELANSIYLF